MFYGYVLCVSGLSSSTLCSCVLFTAYTFCICSRKHHRSDAGMRGNLSERDLERVADRPVCDYCARARLTSMKNEICNVEMWP